MRSQIWNNLFKLMKIPVDNIDIEKLSAAKFNGRQIKNIVRMVKHLAESEQIPLTKVNTAFVESTMDVIMRFE
jgi:hypothetical protein